MTDKLLVTGATGFIGTHCIIELLNHGYEVRGAVREIDRARKIRPILQKHTKNHENLEFTQAELMDSHCWEEAMQGCNGVFHVASPVPVVQPKDANDLIKPAREGTLNVLKAAHEHGITRVVMTSSGAAVWGNTRQGSHIYSESDWADSNDPDQTPYTLSKTLAEKAAWKFVKEKGGPELVVINPSFVFGPALEPDYGSSLEILVQILKGKLPLLPKLGFEIVDVRDVALLHRLAYEASESPGRRFLCSSGFRWMKEMAIFLRENFPEHKNKISTKTMPNLLFKIISLFDASLKQFLSDLEIKKQLDTSAARMILGWQPKTPEEAIKSGARSLIELGII